MKAKDGDPAGVLGIAEGAAQAQAALNLMAQTMLALRSRYEEGSKGYETMTAAAERMMEVQRALQLIEAVLGVVHQASAGDVYTAIPRMIGVAAMMASMGLQTGLIGKADNAKAKYAVATGQEQTGVFGDPAKASESILDALEIVRDNSSNDLNYSAAMLRALEGIDLGGYGASAAAVQHGIAVAPFARGVRGGVQFVASSDSPVVRGILLHTPNACSPSRIARSSGNSISRGERSPRRVPRPRGWRACTPSCRNAPQNSTERGTWICFYYF